MKFNFEEITLLFKNKKFNEAIKILNKFIEIDEKNSNYHFLKGFSNLSLNNLNNAEKNFTSAININDKNSSFYFYRGLTHHKLNKFSEAVIDYNKAITLKPTSPEYYNNLAQIYYINGKNDQAIDNFIKSVNLNNNSTTSILGLANVLSQTKDVKNNDSKIIFTHNKLKEIKFEYSTEKYIDEKNIKSCLNHVNEIIDKNIKNLEIGIAQTFREQKSPPNCSRHKKIFNTYSAIPKFCFGCYKIQIDLNNVVDLIKLHFVFDNFNFKNDNIRKCMIELRSGISGKYKGLIFCNSIEESENIIKELKIILFRNFNKELKYKIKRGCSEYAIKYPEYDSLKDNAMKYNFDWEKYEKIIDEENPDLAFNKNVRPTIKGLTLFDSLVIRNWLAFARMIGDNSYKIISNRNFYSNFVEKKLKLLKII
ncbi:tetratricopeptide repeat protein [Candidatus Pelagibacter sp.]|nr:tetratricopeptide repeat protein [Candidatus Pelagibacter sp.]|tara:strand:+ start:63 stop:1328 length:1266 start_codon:yes stop_codon:yes gene_type:complete